MSSVKSESGATAPQLIPEILLEQVSFTYRGADARAIDGARLVHRAGETIAIVGPSAAGKSTLVKCLNRIVPGFEDGILEGTIRIGGRELGGQRVCDVAPLVGMVFQDFESQLFSSSVASEVAFAMEQRRFDRAMMRSRVRDALSAVGLAGFEGRDPATLSGGEKQRLAIAAVMALRPRVIVLDEPTTDLDPQGRAEIFTLLEELRAQGLCLVIIEHDLEALRRCDRIILLREGKIVADAAPAELLPRVDLLEQCGVRPTDLDRLCHRLQVRPPLPTIDHVEAMIRGKYGISGVSPGSLAPSLRDPGAAAQPAAKVARTPAIAGGSDSGACGREDEAGGPALIEARELSYAYPHGNVALHGVSLTIREREFLAIVGQNGSGKSTLAKLIAGLMRPTTGELKLQGRDRAAYAPAESAREIGFVFQNPDYQIFAATVEDEIAFGPRNFGLPKDEIARRVESVLKAVGLDPLRRRDPFLLGKGERQRLAVAGALALRPRLLLLDEPTTGLDYREQRRMMDLLAELNRDGVAIAIITHAPWLVATYARRVVMLRGGEKVFDGAVRAFFARQDLLANSAFRPPEVTALGLRLGLLALSVEELANLIEERG
jgi:energy-coupling factor transport system ATP-binding protein